MSLLIIDKVVGVCNLSLKEVEKKWEDAKKIVKKEYSINSKSKRFYPLTVGVFKKSLGYKNLKKLGWAPVSSSFFSMMFTEIFSEVSMETKTGVDMENLRDADTLEISDIHLFEVLNNAPIL